jgi:hypothetical protein
MTEGTIVTSVQSDAILVPCRINKTIPPKAVTTGMMTTGQIRSDEMRV